MNDNELLILARRVGEYNALANTIDLTNIMFNDMERIKDMKIEREKLRIILEDTIKNINTKKILSNTWDKEDFNKGFQDIDIIIEQLKEVEEE